MQELLDLADEVVTESEGCGKCGGHHNTNSCTIYPLPPEDHPDALLNKGKCPVEIEDIKLPETMRVVNHKGDGSCVFHAMAYLLYKTKEVAMTGVNNFVWRQQISSSEMSM